MITKQPVRISSHTLKAGIIPDVLQTIWIEWAFRQEQYVQQFGDRGAQIEGAGFSFLYNRIPYVMSPFFRYKGNLVWEDSVEDIYRMLQQIGCINVCFDFGTID